MPRQNSRKKKYLKALFTPNEELTIGKAALIKNLNLVLQAPWRDNSIQEMPEKPVDSFLNRRSLGLFYVHGNSVRLQINRVVINWIINTELILSSVKSPITRQAVINNVLKKLLPFLQELYECVKSSDDNDEIESILPELEQSLRETFGRFDANAFLDAIINASIVDLNFTKIRSFKEALRDHDRCLAEGYDEFYIKRLHLSHQYSNSDFLKGAIGGVQRFFDLLQLKENLTIKTDFEKILIELKARQLTTIIQRTTPKRHILGDILVLLAMSLMTYSCLRFCGVYLGLICAAAIWIVMGLGFLDYQRYNRIAKPEYKVQSKVNYLEQQDAALERIFESVNIHAVKIRFLEKGESVTVFRPKDSSRPTTSFSRHNELPTEIKLKQRIIKQPANATSKDKISSVTELRHKKLPSLEWNNKSLPSFSPNNVNDPTKPFPVCITGIPYGRIYCLFPAIVAEKLKEHGIDNLIDAASQSGAGKGQQGIVEAKNEYATKEGIFKAVAKLKFIGGTKHQGKAKGCVRVYMREGAKGPNGETLLIGDGLQADHQFSNS